MLTQAELTAALTARHGEEVQKKLSGACIGIAGLGGLGSNIAVHMARLGVGRLVLADFDTVDRSNLNRQQYYMDDLGKPKTAALKAHLLRINPYLEYETHQTRITPENAPEIFSGCTVICEAFDRADQKAMLTETLLSALPHIPLVSGSGMAGYGSPNAIRSEKRLSGFYLCGDGVSDMESGLGLMAPRVALCAAHEATVALRLILGETSL